MEPTPVEALPALVMVPDKVTEFPRVIVVFAGRLLAWRLGWFTGHADVVTVVPCADTVDPQVLIAFTQYL